MVTLNGHFDGKRIVLDEPFSLPFQLGARLKVSVEPADEPTPAAPGNNHLQPLNIHIDPQLSNAIALDPEFNVEES